ncbi:uncharacterized protein LOC143906539 [Temnothorax americanus]|uniref:uncharacterized protein LOC143906539 n=1 Tax=Temnothorax americanus TaxID=1964332 RepID=UPI0040684174
MTEKTCYAVVEFMDGLQVIPTNWLSQDLRSALWPNFTNNKSYDKAIKQMIDPESTWASHSIKKIFGTFVSYVRAMKKLKEAEDTSDLNSGTEKEEFLKKSRKQLEKIYLPSAKKLSGDRLPLPTTSSNSENEPLEKIYLPSAKKLSGDRLPLSTTSSNSNSKDENFKNYIITKIITFESAIDNIKKIKKSVKLIANKLSIDIIDKKQENMDTTKDFPLKNQTELDTLEDKLQNDEGYRNELIKQLCRARSGNMRTFCIRLIRRIFSNELATKYSWLGTKKKEIFSTLHICKVIMSVIRKSHSDVSDDQIAALIKIWLAHAPERFNRQKINNNQEDNQEENREENREENQDEEN